MVECLPVVQGGMARNSSKVRTRGLQHFQPRVGQYVYVGCGESCRNMERGVSLTLLALVEDGRAWVVDALLVGRRKGLPARLVDAFLGSCHVCGVLREGCRCCWEQ
jgi:hypothetical protein